MAVIGINYTGGNDYDENDNLIPNEIIYECVYLHTSKKEYKFNSGDFVKDWYYAKKKYLDLGDKEPHLSGSSTCDHFQMNGAKYDSGYLHIINGKPVLKYVDVNDPNYLFTQREIYQDGWEFFVNEGTEPTWEELKEYCNDTKKKQKIND